MKSSEFVIRCPTSFKKLIFSALFIFSASLIFLFSKQIKDGTAASKTARAVKSKYGTISSKKGAQQHGSVVGKAGSNGPVQRQVETDHIC